MVGWPHLIDLGWYWFFLSVGRTDPSGSAYWFVSICSISLFSTGSLKIIINELTAIEGQENPGQCTPLLFHHSAEK